MREKDIPPDTLRKLLSEGTVKYLYATEHRGPMPAEMSEKELQAKIIEYAQNKGWIEYHTYLSVRSRKGFPDLVLCRDRVIYAELKDESGTLTKDQKFWRDRLQLAKQEWYLWRPSDWPQIKEALDHVAL